jgi:signal transduction histidine kinase
VSLRAIGTAGVERGRLSEGEPVPGAVQALRRRLLARLRAEVLHGWQSAPVEPDASDMLEMMGAFESVREQLEPNWDEHLASRLAGPDGLSMMVEVAHDLRSPLTSILFLADPLRKGQSGEVNDVQRRQLGIIYSAAFGLLCMMSDVIELAQGGDRLMETERLPFSVGEIMNSVQDIVQPLAEEKSLTIRLLPPDEDLRLGYPTALSRVLLNLTTNALKYTEEGFVEIVAQPTGEDRLEFSVRDTGPGLTPDAIERLYQPFRRERGRKAAHFSGTGLGLSICRKLVEAMDSELHLETRPGWGTRFHFELELPCAGPA